MDMHTDGEPLASCLSAFLTVVSGLGDSYDVTVQDCQQDLASNNLDFQTQTIP